jgi:DNA repair exonuclease SbcCD ATPase subunit
MLLRHVDSARRNELTQMLSEREQLLQQLRLEKLQWEEKAAQDSAAQATLAHELRNSESTIKQLNEHNTLLADGCRELERCQEAMETLERHNHRLQEAARELQARLAANAECGSARFPPSGRPCAAPLCENSDLQPMTGNVHPLPCIRNPAMCIGPCSDG